MKRRKGTIESKVEKLNKILNGPKCPIVVKPNGELKALPGHTILHNDKK